MTITTTNSIVSNNGDTTNTTSRSFHKDYKIGKELGAGAYAIIREGTNLKTNDIYTIKIANKSKLDKDDETTLLDEISVLQKLSNKNMTTTTNTKINRKSNNNTVQFIDLYNEAKYFYIITEKINGGELFDYIANKYSKKDSDYLYNEKDARYICKCLIEGIDYCHQHNIVHRDLKPENLVLQNKNDETTIKITGFGFSKKCATPNSLSTQCGTPAYVAPEILEGVSYGTQVDMWSLGCIMYILLGGYPPFIEFDQRVLFNKIRGGEYEFHDSYWSSISQNAKVMIALSMTVDPIQRATAARLLDNNNGNTNDNWLLQGDAVLSQKDLNINFQKFIEFNKKRKIKSAVAAVIAGRKTTSLGINFKANL